MTKFKAGDKVRVKDDLVIGRMYGVNIFSANMEKYKGGVEEIELIDYGQYRLRNSESWWTDEMLEEVKENEMEKTFREVIADIKEGQAWDDGFLKIEMISGTISIGNLNGKPFENIIGFVINPCRKFKLQRKEYTFEEAFKAYEEGKEIESNIGMRFKKIHKTDKYFVKATGEWVVNLVGFELEEIRNKWYIND